MTRLGPTQFFGETVVRRQLPHLFITDNVYGKGTSLAAHEHERAFLAICISGSYSEWISSTGYERIASTVAFHPALERHSSCTGAADARVISAVFSPSWIPRLDALLQDRSPKSADLRPIAPVLSRLKQELMRTDTAAALVIESCVLEILAAMIRPSGGRQSAWFKIVVREIESHFQEPLSLSTLAEIAGIHPVHLAREFRRRSGRTIGQYVRELRVRQACEELRNTRLPLAEIALRAGFADQSHLGRWIKRCTGLSPRQLRLERSKS
jgi:AraC family transcriptional regulator